MGYVLDYTRKQSFQLSNDAFFYLLEGEDPIDEDNLEEAYEIIGMFPNGYQIENNWFAVAGTDLIECEVVPYVAKPQEVLDYDEYCTIFADRQILIKYLEPDKVRAWIYKANTKETILMGDFKVYINKFKKRVFHTGPQEAFTSGKSSLFYLQDFKKRGS